MIRFLSIVGALAFASLALAFYLKRPTPAFRALETRAVRIFEYDRAQPGRLNPSQVRALGIAIGFHDESGTRTLVTDLERQLSGLPTLGSEIPRMKGP